MGARGGVFGTIICRLHAPACRQHSAHFHAQCRLCDPMGPRNFETCRVLYFTCLFTCPSGCAPFQPFLFAWGEKETPRANNKVNTLSSRTRTRQHHQEAGAAHRAAQESEERWRRRCSGPRLRCDNQQTVLCRHARCVQRTLLGLLQRLNRSMREPSPSAQEHSHMRAFPTRRHSTKSTHKHTALRGDGFG